MARENVHHLIAFLAVGKLRNFARAAAQRGVSQSAPIQTIRGLEERLGLRLLTHTTRSVAPTGAGERLLRIVGSLLSRLRPTLPCCASFVASPPDQSGS